MIATRGNGSAPASYYDRPVLKSPVWKDAVGLYFFTGGLAGASGVLTLIARLSGRERLARSARLIGLASAGASAPLLIEDLGRPERFLHMLRVFKPTSPMSLGTWLLTIFGGTSFAANLASLTGPTKGIGALADTAAAALGLPLATYTAVLLADTQVPVWHEARRTLPFAFAATSAASAGAAACLVTEPRDSAAARRVAVAAAVAELAAFKLMEEQLGPAAEPYKTGKVATMARVAKVCTSAGAAVLALGGRWRSPAMVGSLALLAGAVAERLAILHAGRASAEATRGASLR